jgi:hypothetical protein
VSADLSVTYELYQTVQTEMGPMDVRIFHKRHDLTAVRSIAESEAQMQNEVGGKLKEGFFWVRQTRERVIPRREIH